MNCSRFRFLIQRKFDENLLASDESQLLEHIETCDSCTRFYQQMDRLVQAAADLTLPEEAVPENLESLARLIIQQLPQQKASIFSFFEDLFKKNKAVAQPAANKPASHFPHVKRQQSEQNQTGSKIKIVDDQQATSARLKSISRFTQTNIPAQPTGDTEVRSLGEKLGLSMPAQGQEEGPLNLAETIRRKMTEDNKVVPSAEGAFGQSEHGLFEAPVEPSAPAAKQEFNDFSNWDSNSAPKGGSWTEAPALPEQFPNDSWVQQPSAFPAEKPAESGLHGASDNSGFTQPAFDQKAGAQSGGGQSFNDQSGFNPSQTGEMQVNPQPPQWEPSTTSWGNTAIPPKEGSWQDSPGQDVGQQDKAAWSQDAEQVQTGFWQAFNLNDEGLGSPAPQAKPAAPAAPGGFGAANPQSSSGSAPPLPPQPAASMPNMTSPSDDRWDVPIQDRMRQADTGSQPPIVPAARGPAEVVADQNQSATKPDSLMDRLSNILGDSPSQATPPPAPPILEKLPEPGVELAGAQETQSRSAHFFTEPEFESIAEPFTTETPAPTADLSRFETPIQQRQSAAVPESASSEQGLFKNIDQQEIDRLFADNLGLGETAKNSIPQAPPIVSAPATPPPPVPVSQPVPAPVSAVPVPPPAPVVPPPVPPTPVSAAPAQSAPAKPATPPPPIPPPQQLTADQGGGLLGNLDDSAIDQLFADHLGVDEQVKSVSGSRSAPAAPVSSPMPAPAAAAPVPPPMPTPAAASPVPPPMPAPAAASPVPPPMPAPAAAAPVPPPMPTPAAAAPVPPPMPTPAAPAAPAASAAPPEPANKGLFSIDDDALDKIFADNLGVQDNIQGKPSVTPPQVSQSATAGAPVPPAPQVEAAPQPIAPPPLPVSASAAPVAPPAPAVEAASPSVPPPPIVPPPVVPPQAPIPGAGAAVPADVSPVAKASPAPSGPKPPKIEGMGRLDKNTEAPVETGSGRISSIGKFLLDQQDLVKLGEFTSADMTGKDVRILTTEANQELQTLLSQISGQPGVIGSAIVGHDGILIANNLPGDMDPESIGVWGLGIYLNTDNAVKKMGHSQVHQVVARSQRGYVVIADFGGGILVTVSDSQGSDALLPLMRCITQLVAS